MAQIRATLTSASDGGATQSVSRPDPDGWGTLAGTFTITPGTTIPRPALRVDDAACRAKGPILSEQVIVDPATGGLKNVLIFFAENTQKFANADLWVHPDKAPGADTTPVIYDQLGCVFTEHVLAMRVAQPLLIRNSDTVGHNTKLDPKSNKPISPSLAPGGEAEPYLHQNEEREPYGVSCNIHPWMKAYILARDNGYFDVTDEQGKFRIENLPAEVDFTIKVWHEKLGFVNADVTVNGQTQRWQRTGVQVKVPKGGEQALNVVLDASLVQ